MIETPHIAQSAALPAAVIPIVVARDRIKDVMGRAICELMSAIAVQGIAPAGPVFAHRLRCDPDRFVLKVGVPVATLIAAAGRTRPGELPATPVARTLFHGDHEGLPSAGAQSDVWLRRHGQTPAANLWECLLAGPSRTPDPRSGARH
jgi:hypothetical protein